MVPSTFSRLKAARCLPVVLAALIFAGCGTHTPDQSTAYMQGTAQADSAFYLQQMQQSSDDTRINWQLLAIRALVKEGKTGQAVELFNQLPQELNDSQRREKTLLAAEIKLAQKDFAGAQNLLAKITPADLEQNQQARYWQAKIDASQGRPSIDLLRALIAQEPLLGAKEKQQNIDFDTMEEFDFVFDIALAPEFKAEVSAKDKVDYYSIEVSEEMIDNQVKMYTLRTGKYDKVDAYEDNDMLKGLLAQLDEEGNTKEGGIQVEAAVLMPAYMKNDEQKAIFANAKVNDVLVFNPNVAYDGHAAELGSLLKIDKEIAKDVKSDFSFQVEEITRFVPGELTQEVFDQAFGEGVVKTEEEFRAKIKEEIAARFVADSDYKFLIDIRKVMMEKVGKLEFSDALLKRIMLLNNEEKGEEYVAENYDKSIEELTWHLIKEQLVEANDIKVEQEDVLKMARETTKAQFAQYGMLSIPDDVLDNYAQEMLKKKETINNLVSRVVEVKLAAALKAQVTLENKNVSIEEFNKMFE